MSATNIKYSPPAKDDFSDNEDSWVDASHIIDAEKADTKAPSDAREDDGRSVDHGSDNGDDDDNNSVASKAWSDDSADTPETAGSDKDSTSGKSVESNGKAAYVSETDDNDDEIPKADEKKPEKKSVLFADDKPNTTANKKAEPQLIAVCDLPEGQKPTITELPLDNCATVSLKDAPTLALFVELNMEFLKTDNKPESDSIMTEICKALKKDFLSGDNYKDILPSDFIPKLSENYLTSHLKFEEGRGAEIIVGLTYSLFLQNLSRHEQLVRLANDQTVLGDNVSQPDGSFHNAGSVLQKFDREVRDLGPKMASKNVVDTILIDIAKTLGLEPLPSSVEPHIPAALIQQARRVFETYKDEVSSLSFQMIYEVFCLSMVQLYDHSGEVNLAIGSLHALCSSDETQLFQTALSLLTNLPGGPHVGMRQLTQFKQKLKENGDLARRFLAGDFDNSSRPSRASHIPNPSLGSGPGPRALPSHPMRSQQAGNGQYNGLFGGYPRPQTNTFGPTTNGPSNGTFGGYRPTMNTLNQPAGYAYHQPQPEPPKAQDINGKQQLCFCKDPDCPANIMMHALRSSDSQTSSGLPPHPHIASRSDMVRDMLNARPGDLVNTPFGLLTVISRDDKPNGSIQETLNELDNALNSDNDHTPFGKFKKAYTPSKPSPSGSNFDGQDLASEANAKMAQLQQRFGYRFIPGLLQYLANVDTMGPQPVDEFASTLRYTAPPNSDLADMLKDSGLASIFGGGSSNNHKDDDEMAEMIEMFRAIKSAFRDDDDDSDTSSDSGDDEPSKSDLYERLLNSANAATRNANEMGRVKVELAESKARARDLQSQLDKADDENDTVTRNLRNAQSDNGTLQKEIDSLKTSCNLFRTANTNLALENQALRQQLHSSASLGTFAVPTSAHFNPTITSAEAIPQLPRSGPNGEQPPYPSTNGTRRYNGYGSSN